MAALVMVTNEVSDDPSHGEWMLVGLSCCQGCVGSAVSVAMALVSWLLRWPKCPAVKAGLLVTVHLVALIGGTQSRMSEAQLVLILLWSAVSVLALFLLVRFGSFSLSSLLLACFSSFSLLPFLRLGPSLFPFLLACFGPSSLSPFFSFWL